MSDVFVRLSKDAIKALDTHRLHELDHKLAALTRKAHEIEKEYTRLLRERDALVVLLQRQ